jgi:hypothetical protein
VRETRRSKWLTSDQQGISLAIWAEAKFHDRNRQREVHLCTGAPRHRVLNLRSSLPWLPALPESKRSGAEIGRTDSHRRRREGRRAQRRCRREAVCHTQCSLNSMIAHQWDGVSLWMLLQLPVGLKQHFEIDTTTVAPHTSTAAPSEQPCLHILRFVAMRQPLHSFQGTRTALDKGESSSFRRGEICKQHLSRHRKEDEGVGSSHRSFGSAG